MITLLKDQSTFGGLDAMRKSTKFGAFFAFTALLENLTVKNYAREHESGFSFQCSKSFENLFRS